MNSGLKKIAFLIGLGILFVSIYWSQDGWNFDIAGEAGYTKAAIFIGWFLAVAVSVLQFVFSSNFKELNMSLIVLGGVAYTYSIYTNAHGIMHFQGANADTTWAWALGFLLDASAEPLIAWSLGVGREGDFLGNIVKTIVAFFNGIFDGAKGEKSAKSDTKPLYSSKSDEKRQEMPKFPQQIRMTHSAYDPCPPLLYWHYCQYRTAGDSDSALTGESED